MDDGGREMRIDGNWSIRIVSILMSPVQANVFPTY